MSWQLHTRTHYIHANTTQHTDTDRHTTLAQKATSVERQSRNPVKHWECLGTSQVLRAVLANPPGEDRWGSG